MADTQLTVEVRGVDKLSPVLKHMESGVIRFVGAVSSALAAITTFAMPVIRAAEFEKAMLEVRKTTDFSAKSISYLGDELLDLSSKINVVAPELARIAAMGGQLGLASRGGASGLLSFTEEVAKAVTALDASADEVAESLGKLINIFNLAPQDYGKVLSTIARVNLESTASAQELFDILRRVGNLGDSVRVDQSAALAGLAIDIGFTAETAGTSLVKIFSNMKVEAEKFAQFMGVTVEEWVEPLVHGRGIEQLKKYLEKLNSIPEEAAARAVEQLSGGGRIGSLVDKLRQQMRRGEDSNLDRLLRTAADEMERGTAAGKAQANVLAGLSAQWTVLGNRINATFIKAASDALPSFTNLLTKLGDSFANPETVSEFSSIMSVAASAADGLATALDKVGGAAGALRGIFDVAFLLLFTKGFAGLRASFNGFVESAVAGNARLRESEAALSASMKANMAVIAAQGKVYAAQQNLAQKRADVKVSTAEVDTAVRVQKQIEDGKVAISNKTIQARRSTLAKALVAERALEKQHQAAVAQVHTNDANDRVALDAKLQQDLKAVTGKGAVARRAQLRAAHAQELLDLEAHTKQVLESVDKYYKQLELRRKASVAISRRNLQGATEAARAQALAAATAATTTAGSSNVASVEAARRAKAELLVDKAQLSDLEDAADEARAHLDELNGGAAKTQKGIATMYSQTAAGASGWAVRMQAAFASWTRSALVEIGLVTTSLNSSAIAAQGTVSRVGTVGRAIAAAFGTVAGAAAAATTAVWRLTLGIVGIAGGGAAIDATRLKMDALNLAIRNGATGMALFSLQAQKALAFVGGFFKALGGIFSRLLSVYLIVDLGKWALEAIGALEPLYKFLNGIIDRLNTIGFRISKLKLPSELKEEQRTLEKLKTQYAEAEAAADSFQKKVGSLQVGVKGSEGDKAFTDSLEARGKAMDSFARKTGEAMRYSLETAGGIQAAFAEAATFIKESAYEVDHLRLREQALQSELAGIKTARPDAKADLIRLETARKQLESIGASNTPAYQGMVAEITEITGQLDRQAAIQRELDQLSTSIYRTDVERAKVYRAIAEGLNPAYVAQVIDSGLLDQLIAARTAYEKAKADLKPSFGADESSELNKVYRQTQENLAQAKARVDALEQQLVKVPSLASIAMHKTSGQVADMVTSLGNANTQLRLFGATGDVAGKRVTSAFRNMAVATQVTAKTYQGSLIKLLANKEVYALYKAQADAARVAAEQATAAIRQLYDKAKKDMEDMREFAAEISDNIRRTQDEVAQNRTKRSDDIEKERERLRIQQSFVYEEERLVYLEEASRQAGNEYLKERAVYERGAFEEKKRQAFLAMEDTYALKEGNRLQQQRAVDTRNTIGQMAVYADRLVEINALLKDTSIPEDRKVSELIPEREQIMGHLQKMKERAVDLVKAMSQAKTETSSLANPQEIEALSVQIGRVVAKIGEVSAAGQEDVRDLLTKQANAFETQAKSAQDRISELQAQLKQYAEDSGRHYVTVSQQLAATAVQLKAPMAAFREEVDRIANVQILSPTHTLDVKKRIDELITKFAGISEMNIKGPNILLDDLGKKIATEFNKEFAEIEKNQKATSVKVAFDHNQMQSAVDEAGKGLSVDVKANVQYPSGAAPSGNTGGASAQYAAGGPVWGAGTSMGDKIRAYLSHGEYVMDALTTRMFGYGFFDYLRKMAKAGTPKLAVRAVLPGFAKGGPVGGKVVGISPTVYKVVTSVTEGAGVAGGFNQPMSLTIPDIGTVPVITTEDVAAQLARQISIASLKRGSRKQRANT